MGSKSFKINSEESTRAEEILDKLSSEFSIRPPTKRGAFQILVRTVLSQNTSRNNTTKAFDNLSEKYVEPKDFADADLKDLEELIRPAGLQRSKSKRLKSIGGILFEKYDGDLDRIIGRDPEEARNKLLELPGVGPKTADCVLLFAAERDVLPVDTHVARTVKRLGFTDLDSDPESVKKDFEPLVPTGKSREMHLLLIELGRNVCKSRRPLCGSCPLENLCPKEGVK